MKEWKVESTKGTLKLQKLLNNLSEDGYDIYQIHHNSMLMEVQIFAYREKEVCQPTECVSECEESCVPE